LLEKLNGDVFSTQEIWKLIANFKIKVQKMNNKMDI